jgi:endonuclease YncB( thermonuclease family)
MLKTLLLVPLVLSFCFPVTGQTDKPGQKKFTYEYESVCGSPEVESQFYTRWEGKITKIADGNTVIFEARSRSRKPYSKKFSLHLAGIDAGSNESEIVQFIAKKFLNKKVEVSGNLENDSDESFFGIVRTGNFRSLNRELFERGLVKYLEPEYGYSVSNYELCIFNQEEEKAQAAKIGIWAK